ncbi:hypothetical protein FDK32_22555 [Citrobacter freundii]|uniref:hypothetical protein n=1 Tax=Citrobacter freundii TaxID=546 RepID=UPI001BAE01F9|nr:hypothetical protein [Citrobacter freundii]MBQ5150637.1 hypothetical protein [Citrobacter freundii]
MNQNEFIFTLDKKYTPYLLKAIIAAQDNGMYDINNIYISFKQHMRKDIGKEIYSIRFYSTEITDENWMDIGHGGIEIFDTNVDVDIKTCEIIAVYGSR